MSLQRLAHGAVHRSTALQLFIDLYSISLAVRHIMQTIHVMAPRLERLHALRAKSSKVLGPAMAMTLLTPTCWQESAQTGGMEVSKPSTEAQLNVHLPHLAPCTLHRSVASGSSNSKARRCRAMVTMTIHLVSSCISRSTCSDTVSVHASGPAKSSLTPAASPPAWRTMAGPSTPSRPSRL